MEKIFVHPQISERHPEIEEADVLFAWRNCLRSVPRIGKPQVGRPLAFAEEMKTISFKELKSKAQAIDERCKELNIPRSDYLRRLVDRELVSAL